MDLGQRVKVIKGLDKGKEGEVVRAPVVPHNSNYNVKLDDGHINMYLLDWLEAINK